MLSEVSHMPPSQQLRQKKKTAAEFVAVGFFLRKTHFRSHPTVLKRRRFIPSALASGPRGSRAPGPSSSGLLLRIHPSVTGFTPAEAALTCSSAVVFHLMWVGFYFPSE